MSDGPQQQPRQAVWDAVREELRRFGINIDLSACCPKDIAEQMKVVCIAPDLKESIAELGKTARDQVVMVRVDEETSKALDAWVETGHVKSRSEAAALFIREGIKIRAAELEKLREALREVEEAREKLRRKAREVFGNDESE